jgi:beta-galactosidase
MHQQQDTRFFSIVATVLLVCASSSRAVETVSIDASSGAPRILVDGKTVRARMFWGAPGNRPVHVGPTPGPVSFEFTAVEDEPAKATLHFRFGQVPGDVYLDDIRVVDAGGGLDCLANCDFEAGQESFDRSWSVWPPAEQNTVGKVSVEPGVGRDGSAGLHVKIAEPPDGKWPDFHIYHQPNLALVKGHRYRVTFWAKAEPARDLAMAFYRPGAKYVELGGPPGVFEQQIQLAAGAGVHFITFPVQLPWPKPGEAADWSEADAACQKVLDANPEALLLPRIGVDAAPWWMEAHPDDLMVWDDGPHEVSRAVPASAAYRHDAAEGLTALVEHLELKYGPHIAGYHPAGQNTGEFFYQDTWLHGLNGYSKCELRAWRDWLKKEYGTDDKLRAAWGAPDASIDSATVPASAARRAAPAGVLRDPATERPLIDFASFQQEMMADCVCDLAKAVRQGSHGRKLVLFFYGYVFEFGPVVNGPATSGHYALRRVLDCRDIDVLCSPISYFDRGPGGSAPSMTAAESVALAGKMWLDEDDTFTYRATGRPPGSADAVDTLAKTNQELLRNTAECALRNFGTWWMDLGATGWFNDPGMWEQMAKLKALDQPLLDHPTPFRPEVAAVIDEPSMIRVAAGGQVVTAPGVYEVRRPLGRMGAPFGQYLLDDVTAGRVHAREYVFLSAWCLDPAQRRQLLSQTAGSLRVWCYAPGFQEPGGESLDAMRELTGFAFRKLQKVNAWATPTAAGEKLGLHESFGVKRPIEPLFAVTDATPEETLATYPDGSAAIAMRKTEGGISLFVGPPGLSSEFLRLAARQAGVHLFTQTDCNVYANGPYIVLHGSQNGAIEVDTGRAGTVSDLIDGKVLGHGPEITLTVEKGQTRILSVEPPDP